MNTPDPKHDLPVVTRRGDRVSMSTKTFDDLIARLLVAEAKADEPKTQRSWWKP